MKIFFLSRVLCAACLLLLNAAAVALTTPVDAAADRVTVSYQDPQQFTEAKHHFGVHARDADAYLQPLQQYIQKRAARILTPGQRLDITVTDVDRAGEYEPWRGPTMSQVRIVKDIYPPRIDVDFTLYDADGKVLRSGSRVLRDAAFMSRASSNDHDTLRYEKAVIDRWMLKGAGAL